VNGIGYYHSGNPITVMDNAFCPALVNEPSVCSDRPDTVPGQSFRLKGHNANEWFNIGAFTPQAFGTAGSEHRNQMEPKHQRPRSFDLQGFPSQGRCAFAVPGRILQRHQHGKLCPSAQWNWIVQFSRGSHQRGRLWRNSQYADWNQPSAISIRPQALVLKAPEGKRTRAI
jgi:hypothetical protein